MLRRVARVLRETPLSAALLLLVALLLLPGGALGSGHFGSSTSTALPVRASAALPASHAIPAVYGTTSVTTSDAKVANNLAMNFSMAFPTAIALSAGQDINVTLQELVGINIATRDISEASIGFWAHYDVGSSTTMVWPVATFGNLTVTHTVVDTAISLTTPGTLVFRLSHAHGYWWTFSTNGAQAIGSGVPAWQNGTYMLNSSSALGYYSFGSRFTFAPTLFLNESGPSLPFASTQFQGVLSPAMQFNTTTAGYQPVNGLYQAPRTAGYAVPMAGYDQCYISGCPWKVGNDTVLVKFPSPVPSVTANGATLWGVPPPPPVSFHTWLGAETVDPSFMNVTGEQITLSPVPSAIPPGGLFAAHEAALPINGTDEMYIGFVDANVTFGTLAYQGVYPFYALSTYNSGTFGIDLTPLAAGTQHTMSIQHTSGWWWTVRLDGGSSSWCTGITSCTGNGTILLNASTAWGETNMTFNAGPGGRIGTAGFFVPIPYSNQPLLAYFGNMSTYSVTTSIQLDSRSGVWGTPFLGNAWSWDTKNSKDVLVGNTQEPWAIPPGSVLVENATAAYPTPLANTTVGGSPNPVWIGTSVTAVATPTTVASGGGTTNLVISVSSGGSAISNAVVNVSDTDAQQYGHCSPIFAPTGTPGDYSGTCWFNASVPILLTAHLQVTVTPVSGAVGTTVVVIVLTPPLTVAALIAGTPSGSTVQAGAALTVEVWTNVSGAGVANAFPLLALTPVGEGQIGPNTTTSIGFYSIPLTIASNPASATATLTIAATGGAGAGFGVATAAPILLNINLPKATVSPVWISGSGPSSIAAGATVTFSVNVTSGSGAIVGAFVHFGVTCNGGTNCTSQFTTVTAPSATNAQGASSWTVTAPANLAQATTFTVTATTTPKGYASASGAALPVTVQPPGSTNNNNNTNSSGSSPLILYALVGVVVVAVVAVLALLMMRKKKSSPPASSAPQGGMESWSPSPEGEGAGANAGGAEPPAGPSGSG